MRFRKLTVVAIAALAMTGLAGCNTKVGAAAVVDGHHISDSDVTQYLTKSAEPFQIQTQSGATQTVTPRSYVLQTLILNTLFTRALAATKGGVPSESELTATETALAQGATPAEQVQQYTKYGFKPSFAPVDIRNSTLETILAQRVGATTDAGPIYAAITKLKVPISVSGRYGSWDAKTLALLSEPGDGLPSFVTLEGASSTASTPTA